MPKVSAEYTRARRAEIVTAARAVFARQGFAGTSMNDLVEATGMSMGALYRYFPSKEDLVVAVADGRDGTVDGEFDAQEPAAELVSRLLTYVSDGPEGATHARLVAQIWADAGLKPALARMVRTRHAALRDHLAARIAARPATGGPTKTDPADLAEFLLAAMIGYASLVATDHEFDRERFRDVADVIMSALS
jgi:TetR/AcrR family transcriptional regulator, transcriptional repressor of aconitase